MEFELIELEEAGELVKNENESVDEESADENGSKDDEVEGEEEEEKEDKDLVINFETLKIGDRPKEDASKSAKIIELD